VGAAWAERQDLATARGVSRLVATKDPAGVPLELVTEPLSTPSPRWSRANFEGFVAEDKGLGHLVVTARDRQRSEDFYRQVLGFSLSDRIVTKIGDFDIDLAFLHVNARHHSLALGDQLPKRLHHFMLQYGSLDDLGRALDRATRAAIVASSLGRHPNDRMLSFYARTPSGFLIELGWGGVEIEIEQWAPTTYTRVATWGHRPLAET
jgi:2,3-dihydroxybiphenyl 1,2-dioxygenase